jgi:hypothetical protein
LRHEDDIASGAEFVAEVLVVVKRHVLVVLGLVEHVLGTAFEAVLRDDDGAALAGLDVLRHEEHTIADDVGIDVIGDVVAGCVRGVVGLFLTDVERQRRGGKAADDVVPELFALGLEVAGFADEVGVTSQFLGELDEFVELAVHSGRGVACGDGQQRRVMTRHFEGIEETGRVAEKAARGNHGGELRITEILEDAEDVAVEGFEPESFAGSCEAGDSCGRDAFIDGGGEVSDGASVGVSPDSDGEFVGA